MPKSNIAALTSCLKPKFLAMHNGSSKLIIKLDTEIWLLDLTGFCRHNTVS